MYETTYIRAGNLAQAQQLLQDNPEATLLAGGQTLVLTLRQRLARPSHVIDIAHLSELKGISVDGNQLLIGAGTRHADVAANGEVRRRIPGLAHLAAEIGDPAVRHMGTIGGSIANSDPAADYPAAVLGLGATVHTSQRVIPADDFFTGLFETALQRGEIVTRIAFRFHGALAMRNSLSRLRISPWSESSSRSSPTTRSGLPSPVPGPRFLGQATSKRRCGAASSPRRPNRSGLAPAASTRTSMRRPNTARI